MLSCSWALRSRSFGELRRQLQVFLLWALTAALSRPIAPIPSPSSGPCWTSSLFTFIFYKVQMKNTWFHTYTLFPTITTLKLFPSGEWGVGSPKRLKIFLNHSFPRKLGEGLWKVLKLPFTQGKGESPMPGATYYYIYDDPWKRN